MRTAGPARCAIVAALVLGVLGARPATASGVTGSDPSAGRRAAPAAASPFHGLPVLPAAVVGEFVLLDQHGRAFSMRGQRGRVVLVVFGYTSCPDVCPTSLGALRHAYAALGAEAGRVRVVFITVDPQRDHPERLRAYLALFHRAFTGLTGSPDALGRAYAAFEVHPQRYMPAGSGASYLVSHPAAIYLVDPDGRLRLSYAWGASPKAITDDVRLILAGR